MTHDRIHEQAAAALAIGGDMSIYRAAELKQQLLGEIEARDVVQLDLSGVTEFDTAGLQLLVLAARTAQDAGKALHLAATSAAVDDVFDLLGLAPAAAAVDQRLGPFAVPEVAS